MSGWKGVTVRVLVLVGALSLPLSGLGQQMVLEVITLKVRSADQVIPLLEPLLAPGATISGLQNRIILRTTPQNLADLRGIIEQVDGMPRRLSISVRQDVDAGTSRSEAGISGTVGNGRARATLPDTGGAPGARVEIRRGDDHVEIHAQQSQASASGRDVQTVQVLEGNEAYIGLGRSVPVRSRTVIEGPQGTRISETVEYRNAETGFLATARVSGERVTVSIRIRRDSAPAAGGGSTAVQGVETVLSGRLGEWLEVGAIGQQDWRSDGGTASRSESRRFDDRRVFLKVEEVK